MHAQSLQIMFVIYSFTVNKQSINTRMLVILYFEYQSEVLGSQLFSTFCGTI